MPTFHSDLLSLVCDKTYLSETKDFMFFSDKVNISNFFGPFSPNKFPVKRTNNVNIYDKNNNSFPSFFASVYSFHQAYEGTKIEEVIKLSAELLCGIFFFEFINLYEHILIMFTYKYF